MLQSCKTKCSLQSLLKLLLSPVMWVNSCASKVCKFREHETLRAFFSCKRIAAWVSLLTAEALGQMGGTVCFIHRAPCVLGALHVENMNSIQILFLFFLPMLT